MQSDDKCVMFDPQFSTLASVAGPWDRGIYGLRRFECDHTCSTYCRRLGLDLVKKDETLPPRPKPRARAELEEQTGNFAKSIADGITCIDPTLLQLVTDTPAASGVHPESNEATEAQGA